jgi:hypothetical protein
MSHGDFSPKIAIFDCISAVFCYNNRRTMEGSQGAAETAIFN